MTKKITTKGVSISGRPNKYWGYDPAPLDCQLVVHCPKLDRASFRRYVQSIEGEGIYYKHSWEKREVVMAFDSPESRKVHEDFLRGNAMKEGYLLDKVEQKPDISDIITVKFKPV